MYRKEFPNLTWLKSRIDKGDPWPTCMLDVMNAKDFRDDIKGPFSLFTVVRGAQFCKTAEREQVLEAGDVFVTNKDEHYTIDTLTAHSHVRNIHFGEEMTFEVMSYLSLDTHGLLDGRQVEELPSADWSTFQITENNLWKINTLCRPTPYAMAQEPDAQYVVGALLMDILLARFSKAFEKKIRSVKQSTRKEVFERLRKSAQHIYTHYSDELKLDDLAQQAGISKFHFQRSFVETFKMTPQKFLEKVRINQAQKMLKLSRKSISEISYDVGYQNPDTLSRKFRNALQVTPSQFRSMAS